MKGPERSLKIQEPSHQAWTLQYNPIMSFLGQQLQQSSNTHTLVVLAVVQDLSSTSSSDTKDVDRDTLSTSSSSELQVYMAQGFMSHA